MIGQHPAHAWNRAVWGVLLLSGLYSGCQTVETSPGHASYYEQGGMWCANCGTGVEETRVAVIAALTHLHMPVYQEGPLLHGLFLDTRTPENCEARVFIVSLGWQGEGTRVSVRISGFGTHRALCTRLLDEFTQYVGAGGHAEAVPVAPVPPPSTVVPAGAPVRVGSRP